MKKYVLLFALILTIFVTAGCTRKFTVASISKDFDFSVVAPYGNVTCTPVIDARSDFDRTGKVESSCGGGTAGVMHLGDKNYNYRVFFLFGKKQLKRGKITRRIIPPKWG